MPMRAGMVSLVVLVVCAGLVAPVGAQGAAPHFVIEGTSTVRSWSCSADGAPKIVPGQSSQAVPGFPHGVQSVEVTVPVKAIDCPLPLMNSHLRESMNEKVHPLIVYELKSYKLNGSRAATATGTLTINGVTKPVSLDVTLAPSPQGLQVTGTTSIDLTQFSITPPVIFAGLDKVGKDVRVRFDWVM